jgi:hypothetical protein
MSKVLPAQSTIIALPGLCFMRIVAFVDLAHLRYLSQNWVDMYGINPSA